MVIRFAAVSGFYHSYSCHFDAVLHLFEIVPYYYGQNYQTKSTIVKRFTEKAPGTYHHSLMVANISANCVEAIARFTIGEVACYYHDIGKTEHPFFFIENPYQHMESLHKMIGPYESKEIIFDHVRKG